MQEALVRSLRRIVLLCAAEEEEHWAGAPDYNPQVAVRLREQARELE